MGYIGGILIIVYIMVYIIGGKHIYDIIPLLVVL